AQERKAVSDEQGRFHFERVYPVPAMYVARHPEYVTGYIESFDPTRNSEPVLRMQPWARAVGSIRLEGPDVRGQKIDVTLEHISGNRQVSLTFDATRRAPFTLDDLEPGSWTATMRFSLYETTWFGAAKFDVWPGNTTRVG